MRQLPEPARPRPIPHLPGDWTVEAVDQRTGHEFLFRVPALDEHGARSRLQWLGFTVGRPVCEPPEPEPQGGVLMAAYDNYTTFWRMVDAIEWATAHFERRGGLLTKIGCGMAPGTYRRTRSPVERAWIRLALWQWMIEAPEIMAAAHSRLGWCPEKQDAPRALAEMLSKSGHEEAAHRVRSCSYRIWLGYQGSPDPP